MRKAWERISPYVLWFLFYSVIGWAYEVFLEVIIYQWGYSDRGVLFGPYCPVYGVGATVFILVLGGFSRSERPLWIRLAVVFLSSMVMATAIELCASYLLEAVTGSWPWQTYRDYAVHFQGRIALSPSIRFGLGGVVFLFLIQPFFQRATDKLPPLVLRRISAAAAAVLVLDLCLTILL